MDRAPKNNRTLRDKRAEGGRRFALSGALFCGLGGLMIMLINRVFLSNRGLSSLTSWQSQRTLLLGLAIFSVIGAIGGFLRGSSGSGQKNFPYPPTFRTPVHTPADFAGMKFPPKMLYAITVDSRWARGRRFRN